MKRFEYYQVSEKTGFLINQHEIITIPAYYAPWIDLKQNLNALNNDRALNQYVEQMPLLSIDYLVNDDERRYCRCILAMATTVFIWHDRQCHIPKILPKSLGVPLRKLGDYFGLMPILTHTDMVLINTVIDTTRSWDDTRCLRIKEQITNDYNWTIFQRETARIELCFAPIITAIGKLCVSIETNEPEITISSLQIIHDVVQAMKNSMTTFNEMDPDYFHLEMRPYLVGWSGDSFPYSGGLMYENEDGSYTRLECIGASAGQSPTLQTLDSLFRISHSPDNQTFFDTMKTYMLNGHREFVEDIKRFIRLDTFVEMNNNNRQLVEAYNDCLKAISIYRTGHMQTVTKFIINPAKRVAKTTLKSEFLQEKGTGGQDLIKFLKEIRDDVEQQKK